MAWKLAELFVSISGDGHPLTRTLGSVKSQLSATGVAFGVFAGNVATGFARMGADLAGGALAGIGDMISKASDLNETINKIQVVFGQASSKIISQANEIAKTFGLSRQEMLDAASSFGLIGKAAGYTEDQAAGLANSMSRLAADATSLYDVPMEVALEKIRAGLVGEAEPLRAFGVLLSETAVKAEAARLGYSEVGSELSESAKVVARASLITKGLTDATGDLARTSGSYSNQVRAMWGRVENTMTDLGTKMLPAATTIVNAVNNLVMDVADELNTQGPMIEAFANRIGEAGKYIAVGWRELPTVFELLKLKAREFFAQVVAVGSNLGGMVWEQFKYGAGQAFTLIQIGFLKMCDFMEARFREVIAGFKSDSLGMLESLSKWTGLNPGGLNGKAIRDARALLQGQAPAGAAAVDPRDAVAKIVQDPAFLAGLFGNARPEFKFGDAFKDLPNLDASIKPLLEKLDAAMGKQKAERPAPAGGEAGPGAGDAAAPAKKKGKAEAITFSLADFAKDLQKGIFGKDQDAKRTADGIGQLVALQKANNDLQSKMLKKPGGPGFAV